MYPAICVLIGSPGIIEDSVAISLDNRLKGDIMFNNCWNENILYHDNFRLLGYHGRMDYWDIKEDREVDWFNYPMGSDPWIFGRYTHAVELIAEFDSQPNLTIDCIEQR